MSGPRRKQRWQNRHYPRAECQGTRVLHYSARRSINSDSIESQAEQIDFSLLKSVRHYVGHAALFEQAHGLH